MPGVEDHAARGTEWCRRTSGQALGDPQNAYTKQVADGYFPSAFAGQLKEEQENNG
jgi:hypothetical protein